MSASSLGFWVDGGNLGHCRTWGEGRAQGVGQYRGQAGHQNIKL